MRDMPTRVPGREGDHLHRNARGQPRQPHGGARARQHGRLVQGACRGRQGPLASHWHPGRQPGCAKHNIILTVM